MGDANRYPRVLVMAVNPISSVQSNGLMMRSLFQGWPRDRLAQVYFPFFHRFSPDGSVCERYLRVNPLGLGREERHVEAGRGPRRRHSRIAAVLRDFARSPRMRVRLLDPVREVLPFRPLLDHEVRRFSRSFRPDVVYTLLGTLGVTRAAAMAAGEVDCPIVPHFTDHWIETKFVGSPFESHFRRRLMSWLDQVVERSPLLLTVSGSMAEAYSRRFGKRCLALSSLVEQEPYARGIEPRSHEDGILRLCYTGNLGLKRWTVLKSVGLALQALRAEGFEARLEIYCSDDDRMLYQRELAIPGVVEIAEWVSPARLPELLESADVLVHVESPDPAMLDYTRFSLSTKISHYMMAGRCLFLVGPDEAGSMREVREMGGGVVVPPEPRQQIEEGLRRVLADASYRRNLGRKARELALATFDAGEQRKRFRRILAAAAGGGADVPPEKLSRRGSAAPG